MAFKKGPIGPTEMTMHKSRHAAGTSLIEVLVVIVVFLVGILAIVQIFPKGFRYLILSRESSVATQLSRAEVERLKTHADELPDQILAVRYSSGMIVPDPDRSPSDFGPTGDSLDANGNLYVGGTSIGHWAYNSGANVFRRIVDESHRIPAPRPIGTDVGGLMVVTFGPIDYRPAMGADVTITGNNLIRRAGNISDVDSRADYEYFAINDPTNGPTLRLPSGPLARQYLISFTASINVSGTWKNRDFSGKISVPSSAPVNGQYPLYNVTLSSLTLYTPGSVELDSVRVARVFQAIGNGDSFSSYNDPYVYKLLDPNLGIILFTPMAFEATVGNDPLIARVSYDVRDWRVLREEFRIDTSTARRPQHQLAVRSLKVGTMQGVDGVANGGIPAVEGQTGDDDQADNLVLVDLLTGGTYVENNGGTKTITVDKSNGIVYFNYPNDTATIRLPANKGLIQVKIEGRAVRAYYRVNNEYAVQVVKGASKYVVAEWPPVPGQCYVGGSDGSNGINSRLYFPVADVGRKVSIGSLSVIYNGQLREIESQDFIVRAARPSDAIRLPYADLNDLIQAGSGDTIRFASNADSSYTGYAVKNVKGSSVAVRVLWNPDKFSLVADTGRNTQSLERWGQGWRKNTSETYLQKAEIR